MAADHEPGQRSEVLQGTLEMLALKLLSVEPMHGWGLSLRLREKIGRASCRERV